MTWRPFSEALYDALRDDPFYRTLEGGHPNRAVSRDAMLVYYDISIKEGRRWGRLGLPAAGNHGISVWSLPLGTEEAATKSVAKQDALRQAMGPECLRLFMQIEASMAQHEAQLNLEGHWYLSILGVSPAWQGRGIGADLVKPVLEEADRVAVPSYLTTFTERNIPFYERLGYGSVGRFPEPVTGSFFSVLVRPAGSC